MGVIDPPVMRRDGERARQRRRERGATIHQQFMNMETQLMVNYWSVTHVRE